MRRVSTIDVYERALHGETVHIRGADGSVAPLPASLWLGTTRVSFDLQVLRRCTGPTIDIGCGPGRFVSWLTEQGTPALGVDVSRAAVRITRARGGVALRRDLFGELPAGGRWHHALLLDGNIGIGADPVRLLNRVGALLRPGGTALVELDPPGVALSVRAIRLETDSLASPWFPWARAGIGLAAELADAAGMQLVEELSDSGRHLAMFRRVP